MSVYITIDGGTTSTRLNLLKDKVICDTIKQIIKTDTQGGIASFCTMLSGEMIVSLS